MTRLDPPLPVTDHLRELRRRAAIAAAAIALATAALLPLAPSITKMLARPLIAVLPAGTKLAAFTPFEAWSVYWRISIIGGLSLALPFIVLQLLAFARPAISSRSSRVAIAGAVGAALLFIGGAGFCYAWVLPAGFRWAARLTDAMGASMLPRLESSLSLVVGLLAAFGLAFELPIAMAAAMRLGLVTRVQLSRGRPYAIVAAFVVGAVLTPPDVLSQCLLAIPLMLLYEAGILLGRILVPRVRETEKGIA